MNRKLNNLPLIQPIETQKVLKKVILANRALGNLNGVARIIPNSAILINSLVLQEAKDIRYWKYHNNPQWTL